MIQFKNITKTYHMGKNQFQALRGVDFTIAQNELVAIVGPSGSGKSTTMHIMGLLDSPSNGEYLLDGKETSSFNSNEQAFYRNQKIGFIFQQFFLLAKLTALDNVALPLLYRNVPRHERQKKALAILDHVGMKEHAKHRPHELSGGQQQRVAIARALVGDPEIILADEPTGALDTKTSQVVIDLLKSFSKQATIVIITHDLEVAAQCPRQLHILDGVIDRDER
ncbi:MAG: macrolide ABC transporter ATP-binding protein [Coxiella sp. (in: Bacteria)]|nr:MAG: macrolide ABC transporter ATP-binding protein [Coxiella sp. (in: g-proteobacteria)]